LATHCISDSTAKRRLWKRISSRARGEKARKPLCESLAGPSVAGNGALHGAKPRADDHVGLAPQHRREQFRDLVRRVLPVAIDQHQGGDAEFHGPPERRVDARRLPHVGAMPDHHGLGRAGDGGRLIRGPVVDHQHQVGVAQGFEHDGTDEAILVIGGDGDGYQRTGAIRLVAKLRTSQFGNR
jgi:hypothetical protein